MFRSSAPVFVCACLLAGCGTRAAALSEPTRSPDHEGPGQLPGWLRPIVHTQMLRQREYVNELRWTATSLEFERTGALARQIVQEVQCGRPGEGSDSLDGLVPAVYLDLQEKLRERAYRLSTAAASANTHLVTTAYEAMLDVCARCHAIYRAGPPVELPLISTRAGD